MLGWDIKGTNCQVHPPQAIAEGKEACCPDVLHHCPLRVAVPHIRLGVSELDHISAGRTLNCGSGGGGVGMLHGGEKAGGWILHFTQLTKVLVMGNHIWVHQPSLLFFFSQRALSPRTEVLPSCVGHHVVSRPRRPGSGGPEHPLCSSQLILGSCFLSVALPPFPAWGEDPPPHPGTWSQALRWGGGR